MPSSTIILLLLYIILLKSNLLYLHKTQFFMLTKGKLLSLCHLEMQTKPNNLNYNQKCYASSLVRNKLLTNTKLTDNAIFVERVT